LDNNNNNKSRIENKCCGEWLRSLQAEFSEWNNIKAAERKISTEVLPPQTSFLPYLIISDHKLGGTQGSLRGRMHLLTRDPFDFLDCLFF
jgi:hypothetical protein